MGPQARLSQAVGGHGLGRLSPGLVKTTAAARRSKRATLPGVSDMSRSSS